MHRRQFHTIPIFTLLTFFLLSSSLFGQMVASVNDNLLKIKKTNDFPVTGDGSSGNWNTAGWISLPQYSREALRKAQWSIPAESNNKKNLVYKTSFKVLYSSTGFYCLFKCEDSIITATLTEDFSNLFNEDVVEVFLQPDTTLPAYFEYELSPLNYELPLMIVRNEGSFMGWLPWHYKGERKTKHAVKIQERDPRNNRISWTAEMFIPYSLLQPMVKAAPKKGTKWRGNFYRIDYDVNPVYSGWQLTRKGFHDPEKFGILEFE